MPSASSAKVEKQQSSTANGNAENVDNSAIRQVSVIIEHRIRNLEKRKSKLESYRDIEKSGKELSADQKVAVSKYDEVAQTLEFAREFSKQILQISAQSEKELKKKQKKDETLKKQSETSKIREVLIIQNILTLITEDSARDDFLTGSNGACKLNEVELDLLNRFYGEITPKRCSGSADMLFKHAAQKSADHLSLTIDGREKAFLDTTYANVKNILRNIQKCGYFDQTTQPEVSEEVIIDKPDENLSEENSVDEQQIEQENVNEVDVELQDYQETQTAVTVPVPSFPPQPILPAQPVQVVPQIPLVQPVVSVVGITNVVTAAPVSIPPPSQMHPSHLTPTTVRAVEQAYFKQHQYMQQIRPLAEVIGTGNFFFLQDSELDSPDILPGYQQQHPQNSLINPTPPSPAPPQTPQILQQQVSTTPQISTQTFSNESFQSIVPAPIFTGIKPVDVPQSHIPGFATANAPIPIPLIQTPVVSIQQPPLQNQQTTQLHSIPPGSIAISVFPPTGKFATPILHQTKTQTPTKETRVQSTLPSETKPTRETEQRVPEINEWKPEDATKPTEEITEWRDPYTAPEVSDWNEETTDDTNTWSNSQRYQYRKQQGGYRNNRGPSGRTGGSGGSVNGYRGRQIGSYNPNGRQSGGSSGNTFYRNNDNFYQNQNGTGGGGGGYRGGSDNKESGYRGDNKQDNSYRVDKQDTGHRENKLDGGFKPGNNFRSRENTNGPTKGSRISRNNSNSAERGMQSNQRQATVTNPTNRNPAIGSVAGSASTRPNSKGHAGGGNAYGGGQRPNGGSTRPQQSVNV